MPVTEQVPSERYRMGQRTKAVILEVAQTSKGPRVVLSRSHPNFLRRLFEIEVPEILSGVVELKAIAREAGSRSKVAVAAKQEGVDPVGCCVGLRGIRIQNIVNELSGEKIDVVTWSADPATYIANALSPAQIMGVRLDQSQGVATVAVPDKQLSLAIGKEGQNVRLAAKLTGWRIDIKSASSVEAERAEVARRLAEAQKEAKAGGAEPAAEEVGLAPEMIGPEPTPEPAMEAAVATASAAVVEAPRVEVKPEKTIRFAEDIMARAPAKVQTKVKKKKKGGHEREADDEAGRRGRRGQDVIEAGEDEEF